MKEESADVTLVCLSSCHFAEDAAAIIHTAARQLKTRVFINNFYNNFSVGSDCHCIQAF